MDYNHLSLGSQTPEIYHKFALALSMFGHPCSNCFQSFIILAVPLSSQNFLIGIITRVVWVITNTLENSMENLLLLHLCEDIHSLPFLLATGLLAVIKRNKNLKR